MQIDVLYGKDGILKVFKNPVKGFYSVPDENFKPFEIAQVISALSIQELQGRLPGHTFKIVGTGPPKNDDLKTNEITQEDVDKYLPREQAELLKQNTVEPMPVTNQIEFHPQTNEVHKVTLLYSKLLAKASVLKGREKEKQEKYLEGLKEGLLLLKPELRELLLEIEMELK